MIETRSHGEEEKHFLVPRRTRSVGKFNSGTLSLVAGNLFRPHTQRMSDCIY